MKQSAYTIQQFNKDFPDNASCLQHLYITRHGSSPCPSCKRVGRYYRQADTSHYVCVCGKHQISPKKDTIFEKSDTDLQKWFFAMYLFSTSKNGVSAKELERQLGVTYKTAWRIGQQIRLAMKQHGISLSGTVEADETYIGGKRGGTRGRGAKGKTPVFGIHERDGKVSAQAVGDTKRKTVMPLIRQSVAIGSTIMTDTYPVYHTVKKHGYTHHMVNHGAKEYVRGKAHTNTIEGFWSQLKRSIDGTHHAVSAKHLQKYVDEHVWRWNLRASSFPLFQVFLQELSQ